MGNGEWGGEGDGETRGRGDTGKRRWEEEGDLPVVRSSIHFSPAFQSRRGPMLNFKSPFVRFELRFKSPFLRGGSVVLGFPQVERLPWI